VDRAAVAAHRMRSVVVAEDEENVRSAFDFAGSRLLRRHGLTCLVAGSFNTTILPFVVSCSESSSTAARRQEPADRPRSIDPRLAGAGQGRYRSEVHQIARSTRMTSSRSRSEEHTSELQSRFDLVCRLLLEKKTNK